MSDTLIQVVSGCTGIAIGAAILVPLTYKMMGEPVWCSTKAFWFDLLRGRL